MLLDPLAQFPLRLPRTQDQDLILWPKVAEHCVIVLLRDLAPLGIHAVLPAAIGWLVFRRQ